MDEYIDFKLKKAGPEKNKIILFVLVKKNNINYNSELINYLIDKYISIVKKHPELYVCIDARNLKHISKKFCWEGSSELYRHKNLLFQHVRASSFLISDSNLISLLKMIEKIHPFISPTKFCKDNNESLNFLYSHMKKN